MATIKISDLSNEITKALKTYTREVTEGMEEAKEITAKETAQELRKTSPKDTGSYAKGWRVKKVGNARVVHNATDYQLTHLLEKPHALRNGGRSTPQIHIAPAEERAIIKYQDRVEKVIRG